MPHFRRYRLMLNERQVDANIQNTNPFKTPSSVNPSLPLSISLSPSLPLSLTVPSPLSPILPVHMHLSTSKNNNNKNNRCITCSQEYYICRKARVNRKVLRSDMNWNNVGKFVRSAGSEFQTDGAMKLKECSPKDFRFCLGIISNFSSEDRRELDGLWMQRDVKRYRGKDPLKWW